MKRKTTLYKVLAVALTLTIAFAMPTVAASTDVVEPENTTSVDIVEQENSSSADIIERKN